MKVGRPEVVRQLVVIAVEDRSPEGHAGAARLAAHGSAQLVGLGELVFPRHFAAQRFSGRLRDDLDHARIAAWPIEHRAAAARQLDFRDVLRGNRGGIELSVVSGIQWHAVLQQHDVPGAQATDVDAWHTVGAVSHVDPGQERQGFAQATDAAPRDFLGADGADGGDFVGDPRTLPDDRDGFAEAITLGLDCRQRGGNGKCQRRRTQEQSDGPCQSVPVIHGYDCPIDLQYLLIMDPSRIFEGIKPTFVGTTLLEARYLAAGSGEARGDRWPQVAPVSCDFGRIAGWHGFVNGPAIAPDSRGEEP